MPSGINWQQVRADFNDTNNAMKTGIGAISQAGTVFGELRKSILDQEQREIDNAYREKTFNENVRQFGLKHALDEDRFREDVRQFGLNYALNQQRFEEDIRHNKATEGLQGKANSLTEAKFNLEKQDRDALRQFGNILSGQADFNAQQAWREENKDAIKRVEDYDRSQAAIRDSLTLNMAANRREVAALQQTIDKQAAEAAQNQANLDRNIAEAQAKLDNAMSVRTDVQGRFVRPRFLGGSTREDVAAAQARVEEARNELARLQALKSDKSKNFNPEATARLQRLNQEFVNMQQFAPSVNEDIERLRTQLEQSAPRFKRAEMFSNPALMYAAAAQTGSPELAKNMIDIWKSDMSIKSAAQAKEAEFANKKQLEQYKIDAKTRAKLLEQMGNLSTEIDNLNLDPDYAPYFTRVVQNAIGYAAEKGVNLSVKEAVSLVRRSLDVQKVPFRDQRETNSGIIQRIFGGTGTLEKQAHIKLADKMQDDQLQSIVDYILSQKMLKDRRELNRK